MDDQTKRPTSTEAGGLVFRLARPRRKPQQPERQPWTGHYHASGCQGPFALGAALGVGIAMTLDGGSNNE
jgi:hypothetical protein